MQSYLQYKRFRATAQSQLDVDRAKILGSGDEKSTTPNGHDPSNDSRDLEKGLESNSSSQLRPLRQRVAAEQESREANGDLDSSDENLQPAQREPVEEPYEPQEEAEELDEDGNLDLDAVDTQRTLSPVSTQQSERTRLGNALTGVNVRKRTTNEGGGKGNVFVVNYHGDHDPNNPHNWPYPKRIGCTFLIAAIAAVVGIASSIDSSALPQASKAFHVADVVESMATGLFLIGFGTGALFAGPISETVGRNPVYIVTLLLYMIFVMASALAPNIAAQLVFRFIAGFFGSTPLVCAGGSIGDLWSPTERVFAFPVFANAAFTGPFVGPLIGGYIAQELDWRWVDWMTLIISGLVFTCVVLFQPETYPQILLKWKASHLRALTGDDRYRAAIEVREEPFISRLRTALYRPFVLTLSEPIIILFMIYLSVVYIVMFTFLDGYTYIFTNTYGISQGLTGICFAGIIVGLFLASINVPIIYRWAKRDLAKIKEQGGNRLPPEFMLWYSMLGNTFAIPISLFWMGWTANPHISIWSPLCASVLFGYGILGVFITSYQYIIDSYEMYAASALASVTLVRYLAAGGMTIVGIPFYENLGVHYTLTILACLSIPLVPVPFVFYRYGPWIRSKSKYAVNTSPGIS